MSEQTTPWENDANQQQYGELDGYADDYKPERAFKAGIDTMPNGDYECLITAAALDQTTSGLIVRISLQTTTDGMVEWTCWLNKQGGINGFAADLKTLGFDSHKWGRQRPLSVEIPKAVGQLQGIRLRGRKSSRQVKSMTPGGESTTYHDFRVLSRIGGQAAPSNRVNTPAPAGAPAHGGIPEGDIPF